MDPGGDPGWRAALRGLVPWWGLWYRKTKNPDGLISVRAMFLAFVSSFVLIGYVVFILEANESLGGTLSDGAACALVALVGLGSLTVPLIERPLDCADDARLAGSYVVRFFLRVAFAEAAALIGFLAFVLTGSGWMYPLACAFTAIGFWRLAPTAAHLREDEERLQASGCARSLVVALRRNPPGGGLRRRGSGGPRE